MAKTTLVLKKTLETLAPLPFGQGIVFAILWVSLLGSCLVAWSRGEFLAQSVEKMGPLPINYASWPEIATIAGVGPTKARRIVAWREAHGRISQSELAKIPGIGPVLARRIAPDLIFD